MLRLTPECPRRLFFLELMEISQVGRKLEQYQCSFHGTALPSNNLTRVDQV